MPQWREASAPGVPSHELDGVLLCQLATESESESRRGSHSRDHDLRDA
jgi:hypothetical protein